MSGTSRSRGEQIARRAGVGTVYRRFPQRSELVLALLESRVDELVARSEAALEQPDGLSGLRWFLKQFLAGPGARRRPARRRAVRLSTPSSPRPTVAKGRDTRPRSPVWGRAG